MSFLKKRSPDRSPGSIFIFILSYSAQDRACYQRYERQRAVHIFAKRMLADCGFLIYEQLDDEEMTKRYFAPCRDDMRAPKGVNYILA